VNHDFRGQLYYTIVIFSIVLALLLVKVSRAEDCDATLQLCDKAVTECTELSAKQRDLINAQDNLIVKVTKQRNEALDMVKPEAGIPWYVTIVVGIAGGVILTRGLR
jgi:hypothetical protein